MVRVTPNYKALCSPVDKRAASGETCIGISFHRVVFGLQILCVSFYNEEPAGQTILGLFFSPSRTSVAGRESGIVL